MWISPQRIVLLPPSALRPAAAPAVLVLAAAEAEGEAAEAKRVAAELSELSIEGLLSEQNDSAALA